jgi:hypothetical protein
VVVEKKDSRIPLQPHIHHPRIRGFKGKRKDNSIPQEAWWGGALESLILDKDRELRFVKAEFNCLSHFAFFTFHFSLCISFSINRSYYSQRN